MDICVQNENSDEEESKKLISKAMIENGVAYTKCVWYATSNFAWKYGYTW